MSEDEPNELRTHINNMGVEDGEAIYEFTCPECCDDLHDGSVCSCGLTWDVVCEAVGRREE